jgi:hypothetical protein
VNCPTDHIERIKEFGYTESEACFLYIVAVHSGYFTLGQFNAFTGAGYGKRPTSFAQKVLKRGHATIFETEQNEVRFFCDELGVSKDSLPAKVYEGGPDSKPTLRYFVDKFPLFLSSPFSGAPLVVTLSYVDSGFETSSHFVSHLGAYQGLFRQLTSFRFLYIARVASAARAASSWNI